MDEPEQHSRLAPLLANHRRFLAFVERRVESREDAEEILQDAFVRGVERVGDVRDEDSVVAWFYSILRNALVDRHRRRSREPSVLADASELLIAPPDAELHREVCSCIEGLLPLLNPSR